MKEPESGPMAPAGYPVPRRAVLAGPLAAGVLAWARKLAGRPSRSSMAERRDMFGTLLRRITSRADRPSGTRSPLK